MKRTGTKESWKIFLKSIDITIILFENVVNNKVNNVQNTKKYMKNWTILSITQK